MGSIELVDWKGHDGTTGCVYYYVGSRFGLTFCFDCGNLMRESMRAST